MKDSCWCRRRQAVHKKTNKPFSRFTSIFKERQVENAFAKESTCRLCSNLFVCGVSTTLLVGGYMATVAYNNLGSTAAEVEIKRVTLWFDAIIVVWGVVVAILMKVLQGCPQVSGRVVEIVASVMCLMALWLAVFTQPWYVAKVYRVNDSWETLRAACIEDGFVVQAIYLVVAATHSMLPMRWSVLWTVEVGCALTYPVLAIFVGVPDPSAVIYNAVLILVAVVLSMFGRRSAEWNEREVFVRIIHERTLRAETQFKLEKAEASLRRAKSKDCQDRKGLVLTSKRSDSAASTGMLFGGAPSESAVRHMRKVEELGASEKWLVKAHQVELAPDRVLGKGAFSVVVAASYLGAPVAVKMTQHFRGFTGTAATMQAQDLANELRVLRHVRHPNIATFWGAIVEVQRCEVAIILEFVQGPTLTALVRSHRDDANSEWDNARYCVLTGIVAALRYMHGRAPMIVHGDLKPCNILVVERCPSQACPRILDFGLSRVLSNHAKPMGGTRIWCAPEILSYCDRTPRPSVDVYSFGRMWYFIATGTVPLAVDPFTKPLSPELWPRNLTPFAEACQPIVVECTQHEQVDRPSVSTLSEKLLAWPRHTQLEHLRDPWATVFLPAGSAEPPADTALMPWNDGVLQLERVPEGGAISVPAEAAANHRNPGGDCRNESLLRTRLGNGTKEETEEPNLPPTPLSSRSSASQSSFAVSFVPTPDATKISTLMQVAERWVLSSKSISDTMSTIQELAVVVSMLKDRGSIPFVPLMIYKEQCSNCFVLRRPGEGHALCDVCGQAAPMRARSASKGSVQVRRRCSL